MNLHRGARCYHGDFHCLMKIRTVGTLMYQMWNTLTRQCLLDKHHDYIMPWKFFLKLLALCEGILPLIKKGPVMWSFDVFLVVLSKNLSNKQSCYQLFHIMMLIWHLRKVLWCHNTEFFLISLFHFLLFHVLFFPPTGTCGFVFILNFKTFHIIMRSRLMLSISLAMNQFAQIFLSFDAFAVKPPVIWEPLVLMGRHCYGRLKSSVWLSPLLTS